MKSNIIFNYAIIDFSVSESWLPIALGVSEWNIPLFKGEFPKEVVQSGPYLFTLNKVETFDKWLIEECFYKNFGFLIQCGLNPIDLSNHLKKLHWVITEYGHTYLLRYYDPRVLKLILPEFSSKQLMDFFGPINYILCQGVSENDSSVFSILNGKLIEQKGFF